MWLIVVRVSLAAIVAIVLSSLGIQGSDIVLQSLFTVIGISFSIAMSVLISFDLSKVYNLNARRTLRTKCRAILREMTSDFVVTSLFFVFGLYCGEGASTRVSILRINMSVCSILVLLVSLFYELYNFDRIQKFKDDLSDRIMEEEIGK
jgi:hypothetical protein